MKGIGIKDVICKVLEEKGCLTFFLENFNDIDTVVSEFEKKKLNYLIISTEEYMEETLKYMESFKTSGVPSHWVFRDKIRNLEVDLLLIHGYETLGIFQEIFETMVRYDIDSREDLLTKTIVTTTGKFDSAICERFQHKLDTRMVISCR